MNAIIRGTHLALNAALSDVISKCPKMTYGLAVWVYDDVQGYVAPVSSANLKRHDNVDRFNDQFLRTKIGLSQSGVGQFLKADKQLKIPSQNFDAHILTHYHIDEANMVLQLVSDSNSPIEIDSRDMPHSLISCVQNIEGYGKAQHFNYETIFGLKNASQETCVMACDINGFTKYTSENRIRLENIINDAAIEIAEKHNLEIMSIIGDQARFSYNYLSNTQNIHNGFTASISRLFGKPVSIGSVAGKGVISQSFNGRYDDLYADKHYKGEILTHIGVVLKSRPRRQSSLQILKP